jgi:hypothetical protein
VPQLYSSSKCLSGGQIKKMGWAEHMTGIVEGRGPDRVTVVRCEGKRQLGKPRRRRYEIKMDIQEISWVRGLDWSGSG